MREKSIPFLEEEKCQGPKENHKRRALGPRVSNIVSARFKNRYICLLYKAETQQRFQQGIAHLRYVVRHALLSADCFYYLFLHELCFTRCSIALQICAQVVILQLGPPTPESPLVFLGTSVLLFLTCGFGTLHIQAFWACCYDDAIKCRAISKY